MEDRFGHRISYLRVSVTDRCNERCVYCMPQELQEWLPHHEILTYQEIERLVRVASELGVRKVRITGGEPLTRRNVLELFRQISVLQEFKRLGYAPTALCCLWKFPPCLLVPRRCAGFE